MIGLFDWLKIGTVLLCGLILGYGAGHWQGRSAGYDQRIAEEAVATAKADVERRGDDAKLQSMSDYDLCVAGLRSSRMPVEPCSVLRGVGAE